MRHIDLLAGCLCTIKALSRKLDCEKAWQRGGIATFRNRQSRHHSCDQYADGFGRILDKHQDKSGYSASWLLSKLTVPAAAPSHPHQTMGGNSTGLMAPSPATTEVAMPLPSSACPSTPARSYPSHPHRTMGGEPQRVDGTLACYHRGSNTIPKLSLSFIADLVFSHPPSTNDGGERRLGGMPCFGTQSPAFGIHHV